MKKKKETEPLVIAVGRWAFKKAKQTYNQRKMESGARERGIKRTQTIIKIAELKRTGQYEKAKKRALAKEFQIGYI